MAVSFTVSLQHGITSGWRVQLEVENEQTRPENCSLLPLTTSLLSPLTFSPHSPTSLIPPSHYSPPHPPSQLKPRDGGRVRQVLPLRGWLQGYLWLHHQTGWSHSRYRRGTAGGLLLLLLLETVKQQQHTISGCIYTPHKQHELGLNIKTHSCYTTWCTISLHTTLNPHCVCMCVCVCVCVCECV